MNKAFQFKTLFFANLSFNAIAGGGPDTRGQALGNDRLEGDSEIVFKRSFARSEAGSITITETDLKNAYTFGKLEITNVYKTNTPQNIDIGIRNTISGQNWSITGQTFTQKDTSLIVNPTSTQQSNAFPNANIALKEYRNYAKCTTCDDYQFYAFRQGGIYLEGESYLDLSANSTAYEVDTLTFLLSDMPASINTHFVVKDTIDQADTTVYIDGYIRADGFGTLIGSDGVSHQVIKTVQLISEKQRANTSYGKQVNFFSNSGYSITYYLSDTTVTNGIAKVSRIEEKYISNSPTSIASSLKNNVGFLIYPNPVQDVLQVENKLSNSMITIQNTLGNIVFSQTNASVEKIPINVTELEKGVYILSINQTNVKVYKRINT